MFDRETEEKIEELADEIFEGVAEDRDIVYFEGGIVRSAPTGAPPEYITVEVEAIYDENVMWRGVPASLVVGDEVLVWENPKTHRREIAGGSGASTTSTASPWQKVTVAASGGDFALLSAAIAWINALPGAVGPAATRLFAVNVLGGVFGPEAADVTIPQYVHVGGEGEGTVLDMGDATLRLAADSSLQEIVVTSTANDTGSVVIVQGDNAVMDDVRVIITGGPNQECVYFEHADNVELYHVVCESTAVTNYAFNVYHSSVLFWDCHVDDTTNFWLGVYAQSPGNPSTVTTKFCDFLTSTHDVWVLAANTWNHFACNFDPANVTVAGTENALLHGRTRFADKVVAGSFGAPVDVQVTRAGEYGFELHYSGNDYNVTGLRVRGSLITTDAAARTAQAAKLQAANSDGIDAGVVQGALIEAIGKSNATASTISDMRAALLNTEWDAQDTVTDLKTLYVRTHTRNSAVAGYVSNTGYLVYLENEAVGGNGQMLDAAIYVKATNVSTPMAFDYCIDLVGAAGEVNTADVRLSSGGTFGGVGTEDLSIDAAGNVFINTIKAGATQAAAGAAANELWKTNGHASLPNNVVMIGV
jgi:hypothetical protein